MGCSAYDVLAPDQALPALPAHLEQRPKVSSQVLTLLMLAPLAATVATPLLMVATHLTVDADARLMLLERPALAPLLLIAFATWVLVFAYPLLRAAHRLVSRRTVAIADGRVTVIDKSLRGQRIWSTPISEYRGLAHHMRTTVSGVRHELILVHENRHRHVVVAASGRFTTHDVERAARLLAIDEVQPRELYRLKPWRLPRFCAPSWAGTRARWLPQLSLPRTRFTVMPSRPLSVAEMPECRAALSPSRRAFDDVVCSCCTLFAEGPSRLRRPSRPVCS